MGLEKLVLAGHLIAGTEFLLAAAGRASLAKPGREQLRTTLERVCVAQHLRCPSALDWSGVSFERGAHRRSVLAWPYRDPSPPAAARLTGHEVVAGGSTRYTRVAFRPGL